jgi:tetratricopeptide (TPR) repeat protein
VQQVEMLCELPKAEKSSLKVRLLPIIFLNLVLSVRAPSAEAQVSNFETAAGEISGIVLLQMDNRPAGQVVVSLKSDSAGISRRVLTDLEGRFELRSLPPSTYEIIVEEPGYEPTRTSARVSGPPSKLMLYLRPSKFSGTRRNDFTVSVRELKIPGKARNEFQKGLDRLEKKDPAGSLNHFTKAAQSFPDYYEAYYHMGVGQMRLGHNDEAMRAFQMAVDLSGGRYAWAEFGLGYLLCQEGKAGEAERIIRRGLEEDEGSAQGYVILGSALMLLNRPDEAEKSIREALLRNPSIADAYLVRADVYARKGDYRAQVQDLDDYLKLEPTGPASERARRGREAALRILAKSEAQD